MTYDVNDVANVLDVGIVFILTLFLYWHLVYANVKLCFRFTCEHKLLQYMLCSVYYIARLSLKYSIAIRSIDSSVKMTLNITFVLIVQRWYDCNSSFVPCCYVFDQIILFLSATSFLLATRRACD